MSVKTCQNCGGITNTAVCRMNEFTDEKAVKCYAKMVDGKWVKGCDYENADMYTKPYIDRVLLKIRSKKNA